MQGGMGVMNSQGSGLAVGPVPGILTSYALSAHLSLHCLTFPLNNVGTEAIPFFFFSAG